MRKTVPSPDAELQSVFNATILPSGNHQHSFTDTPKSYSESSWAELCAEVTKAANPRSLPWEVEPGREVVTLLAAVRVRNDSVAASLQREAWALPYLQSGTLDLNKLTLSGLELTILSRREDFACGIVEMLQSPLPLFLVHRAGELALIKFLTAVFRLKVAIKPNSIISNLPLKVRSLLHRTTLNRFQRFPAKGRYMTKEEILRWVMLTLGREGVRAILRSDLRFDAETAAKVLLSEGVPDLLTAHFSEKEIATVPLDILLFHGQLRLAVRVLETQQLKFSRKTPEMLRPYQTISLLISNIVEAKSSLSALYLLSMVKKPEWQQPELEMVYNTLTKLLLEEDIEKTVLSSHPNPILFSVTLCELCCRVSEYSLSLRERFLKLSESFLHYGELVLQQFKDYQRLKNLLLEKTYGRMCLFDLITSNTERYRALLKSDTVAALTKDLWTGGGYIGLNFDYMSAGNLYLDSSDCPSFTVHERFAAQQLPSCVFQLYYWKNNGSLRFLTETAMLMSLYGILFSQMFIYLSIIDIMENPMEHMTELQYALDTLHLQLKLNAFITANMGALALNVFQQMVYKYFLKEPFTLSLIDVLVVPMFCAAFINTFFSSEQYMPLIPLETNINLQEPLYAFLMFAISVRISAILLLTRTFGPWIRMIFIIVKDIFVFLVIYLLAVISFSLTFVYLFRRDRDYFGSVERSIRTLFQWSVGGIDATVFTHREIVGSVLAIVWAFVSTIILLNLLVAVLSSRYEELAPQVTADYVSNLYRAFNQIRYEPPYGALVIAPAPFNVVTFPLVPLYFLLPRTAPRLDRYFVVLSYQPLFLLGSVLFLLFNCMVSTLAYFYHIITIVKERRGLRRLIVWIIAGPWYLTYLMGASYARFARGMYREPPEPEPSLPLEVYYPAQHFVFSVCSRSQTRVVLPLSDIESAIAKIPFLKGKSAVSGQEAVPKRFRQAAERIYFSKAQLAHSRSRRIFEFFAQFKSYEHEVVDVTRMHAFLLVYKEDVQRLAGVNIYYAQKALAQLREEFATTE